MIKRLMIRLACDLVRVVAYAVTLLLGVGAVVLIDKFTPAPDWFVALLLLGWELGLLVKVIKDTWRMLRKPEVAL